MSRHRPAPVCLALFLSALWCVSAGAQDDPTTAPADPVGPVDEAARAFDFEKALGAIEAALPQADAQTQERLKRRAELYERYLGMPTLVELARENPDELVGLGATRSGQQLSGFLRLLELGVVPDARIGNRIRGLGHLTLKTPQGERSALANQIAQLSITWTDPAEDATLIFWAPTKVSVVLRDGDAFEGSPTWGLNVSVLGTRGRDDEEDTLVEAYPSFGREFDPENLVAEVVLVGAPTPAAAQPVEPTTQPTAQDAETDSGGEPPAVAPPTEGTNP